jgi:3-oxoacyl-[acyl-carrier protein] reductase
MRLRDKVAIVTGAGQGIGKAIAMELGKEGASVVVCDIKEDNAREVVSLIKSAGSEAKLAAVDVTDENKVNDMVKSVINEFHKIDILVNNVGGIPQEVEWEYFHDSTIVDIRKFIELNLFSTIICSRAVINHMIAQRYGKIVNISSIIAIYGMMKGLAYATAKAALEGFTASLAKEVAEFGINVNSIIVGLAETPAIAARLKQLPERRKLLYDWSHFGRLGKPEEFAKVVVFLASDDSSFMSGASVPVEGGILKFRQM